jgi:NADH:ubiquinone oxidoreductase subunit 5 (subunit L)/multisubunit Na+/H+ antiporter MnhA subunit
VHTWLPDAAAQAPPGAAVLLVGVLDKVGTFGMLTILLPLFPEASRWAAPAIIVLALVSILYGAFVAMAQRDVMRLIAWTSISHFGFIVLGIFAMTTAGQSGSALYQVNHGFSTAALFLVAGMLATRRGSSLIADFGGGQRVMPLLAGAFLVAGLSSLALPGLSSFVSEFLVLVGTFERYPWAAVIATTGIVLAALYILWTYQRMMTGRDRAGAAGRGGGPAGPGHAAAGGLRGGAAARGDRLPRLLPQAGPGHLDPRRRADHGADRDDRRRPAVRRRRERGMSALLGSGLAAVATAATVPGGIAPPEIDYSATLPMLVVAGAAVVSVLLEALLPRGRRRTPQIVLSVVGLLVALGLLVWQWGAGDVVTASGSIAIDGVSRFLMATVWSWPWSRSCSWATPWTTRRASPPRPPRCPARPARTPRAGPAWSRRRSTRCCCSSCWGCSCSRPPTTC